MNARFYITLLIFLLGIEVSANNRNEINELAESYVTIVLHIGQYFDSYVDFYFGPEELIQNQTKISFEDVNCFLKEIDEIDGLVLKCDSILILSENPETNSRLTFLRSHFIALRTKLKIEMGEHFSFDEEYSLLFDSKAPIIELDSLQKKIEQLNQLLEGSGDIAERYYSYINLFTIPPDSLDKVYRFTLATAKTITGDHMELFTSDTCQLKYVTGKPWDAYNTYARAGKSLIQVNTGYPKRVSSIFAVACHEGYPGHHVHSSMWEKYLYKERGWIEFSVGALYTPSYLIYEGIAEYAKDIAFPGEKIIEFQRELLFPMAGLDASEARKYHMVTELFKEIQWGAIIYTSREYLDENISRKESADILMKYSLRNSSESEAVIKLIEYYRTYLVNYLHGYNLIKGAIHSSTLEEKCGQNPWDVIFYIMSNPVLPTDLLEN